MKIKEISFLQFDNFANNHNLSSYHQTSRYALLMSNHGYDYDYIGYVDQADNIIAASLILYKKIGLRDYYGYAPKGFLIDYFNTELVANFTRDLKEYYRNKNFTFIKINPEIAIGEITFNPLQIKYNQNVLIRNTLKKNDYFKLKDNVYFESLIPRYNAFIYTPSYSTSNLKKNIKNKLNQSARKGLVFEKASRDQIDELYKFIKAKKKRDKFYYQDYYNSFANEDKADLFLISIDYEQFLINTKSAYEKELDINSRYNLEIQINPTEKKINTKMNSDKTLLKYKTDIVEATNGLRDNKKVYIAGALTIKHNNRVHIVVSGYDKKYERFNPNHFLHYQIIEHYKKDYTFIDLNGLTGDFTNANPYYGLNKFKLGFNPKVYEFIGEFDLIINELKYAKLTKLGLLAKEFNKKDIIQIKK